MVVNESIKQIILCGILGISTWDSVPINGMCRGEFLRNFHISVNSGFTGNSSGFNFKMEHPVCCYIPDAECHVIKRFQDDFLCCLRYRKVKY